MIYKPTTQSIHDTLAQIRNLTTSSQERGKFFEELMCYFFQQDPLYQQRFNNVWMWSDKAQPFYDGPDIGIDIIAEERNGQGFCAIQCKFHAHTTRVSKKAIDSFLAASGRKGITSQIIIHTGQEWGINAERTIIHWPCKVLDLDDLEQCAMLWPSIQTYDDIRKLKPGTQRELRQHQINAFNDVIQGFESHDCGQLIMACGTGKTFIALQIAEHIAKQHKTVLYLVPTLALVSQTMREWSNCRSIPHRYVCVCSDISVGKDDSGYTTRDLEIPATTDVQQIHNTLLQTQNNSLTVVFATYHSIDSIVEAQNKGAPTFDLAICDEAHHTTGVEHLHKDKTAFTRIHDHNALRAHKRLFMTATPRLYTERVKAKAEDRNISVYSMDDETKFGPVFHKFRFSQAIDAELLSDYRVLVLHISERYAASVLEALEQKKNLTIPKIAKFIGCWKALLCPGIHEDGTQEDVPPLSKAIAFNTTIHDSQLFAELFWSVIQQADTLYAPDVGITHMTGSVRHIDGKDPALKRKQYLNWLGKPEHNTCNILTNARCLSEGVDVPALDAILFLGPRRSVVDIVQAVGRVMRKSQDKQYGYIVLPVIVPPNADTQTILNKEEAYQTVWDVLRALRSHDDRLNTFINQIDLNQTNSSEHIKLLSVSEDGRVSELQLELPFGPDFNPDAIYAKIVEKVGDRQYWEWWAKDIAKIARNNIQRIQALLQRPSARNLFDMFVKGLRETINPDLEETDALTILSQHMITKPVFAALFEKYDFARRNPVSQTMEAMVKLLVEEGLEHESGSMKSFYDSVRTRAKDVKTLVGRQTVIKDLYQRFFQIALSEDSRRLGIVYTPTEIIDFILHSANAVLKEEFGLGLSAEGVHILDPFTGTGSFMVRLLQDPELITDDALDRKFEGELHANDSVLLAYYIAAVSIEESYHSRKSSDESYKPFRGIAFCDTFKLLEKGSFELMLFPENSKRVRKQQGHKIKVIVGNPPWSTRNEDLKYPTLDKRIFETYKRYSSTTNKNTLYDSYIRALRWSSDRVEEDGLIAFVTNASFIESNAGSGIRKCLAEEFQSIYCFHLRGNIRKYSKAEGGSVFGNQSQVPVAITVLVKNTKKRGSGCKIYYKDIGDYLTTEQKLQRLVGLKSISGVSDWEVVIPDRYNDWINLRDASFYQYLPLGTDDTKKHKSNDAIFRIFGMGVSTTRDSWVYNSSKETLRKNMQRTIAFYNRHIDENRTEKPIESLLDIKWTDGLEASLRRRHRATYTESQIRLATYRPFFKQWLYCDPLFNHSFYKMPVFFPTAEAENLVICITGKGVSLFSVFITNTLLDLNVMPAGSQCFPRYTYEKPRDADLLEGTSDWTRIDNILDETLHTYRTHYQDNTITKDDIFYYIYGLLHSPEYRSRYRNNLTRELPRIPMASGFRDFELAGRRLAYLHLYYERLEGYPLTEERTLNFDENNPVHYHVKKKLKFALGKGGGKDKDRSCLIINEYVKILGIPEGAFSYEVGGRSPLMWLLDRYVVDRHKESDIENDANCWKAEDPGYLVRLIGQLVRVGIESYEIIESLPSPFE